MYYAGRVSLESAFLMVTLISAVYSFYFRYSASAAFVKGYRKREKGSPALAMPFLTLSALFAFCARLSPHLKWTLPSWILPSWFEGAAWCAAGILFCVFLFLAVCWFPLALTPRWFQRAIRAGVGQNDQQGMAAFRKLPKETQRLYASKGSWELHRESHQEVYQPAGVTVYSSESGDKPGERINRLRQRFRKPNVRKRPRVAFLDEESARAPDPLMVKASHIDRPCSRAEKWCAWLPWRIFAGGYGRVARRGHLFVREGEICFRPDAPLGAVSDPGVVSIRISDISSIEVVKFGIVPTLKIEKTDGEMVIFTLQDFKIFISEVKRAEYLLINN